MDWTKERLYTERPRMHHNRRKKKRVNCNVRAVEVVRGAKGFGFTISGQQPCILSCIVQGSPAESAGLRSGDYLVSVNGQNVSKVPHDNVVQLIGKTKGVLRLQIVENYYSDSTDEEGAATVRSRPKYTHKPCAGGRRSTESKNESAYARLHHRWNMSSPLPPPLPPVSHKRDSEKIVHRTVVGYLGTIDIPNQLHPSSMMQVLRKCIKRLKAEKRNPATVLLTIHVANIKLTNSGNRVIAEYPSYRIIFCNSFSEQDKQYFGILTKSVKDRDDIVSNSCHVFTIYYKLIDHTVHSSACNVFGFTCTKTSELNGVCQEFPDSCNGLIGAIQTLYISDSNNTDASPYNETRRHQDAASPQPSNVSTSTAHSSNSDSGIGFKDDYGCRSDKNNISDFSRRRQCLTNSEYRDRILHPSPRIQVNDEPDAVRLTVRALSNVGWNDVTRSESCKSSTGECFSYETVNFDDFCNGLGTCSAIRERGERDKPEAVSDPEKQPAGRGEPTTCPLPSATVVVPKQGLLLPPSSSVDSLAFACTTALLNRMDDRPEESSDDSSSIALMKRVNDTGLDDALRPKPLYPGPGGVVVVSKSLVHSLEDLNSSTDYARIFSHSYPDRTGDNPRPWGSLQEIRNLGGCSTDTCLHGSTELCEKSSDCKGIHTWTSGFEKLLEDPKGLQTFAEFLKKEFSHENIYFWAACERYKDTKDIVTRRKLAGQIYQRHLSSNAAEPVNVDSHAAGQITQDLLTEAPADLFLQAQKQVFNLMKFDSYPRFLRSDLYRRCIEAGNAIVGTEDCDLNLTSSPGVKLKKSHSDAEDRCRKSILPWNRKNRSKSKDRGESEYNKAPSRSETIYKSFTAIKRESESNNNDDSISISSSRSSLASWDLALRQSFHKHSLSSYEGQSSEKKEARAKCTGLCRVILPDGSTTVVPTSQTETIKDVVTRLLDKRALRYSNYDVLILATDEMVDSKYPSSTLAGQEVEVVPTKVLKVDLPSRRVITVIAHKGRTLKDVLRPLLNKYGFNVDLVTVRDEDRCVSMDVPAINAPARLTLTVADDELQRQLHPAKYGHEIGHAAQTALDEFTNKAFEEFLVGKSTNKYQYNEGSSCKSDDQHSEGSSSVLPSKFFLRDSTMHGKKKGKSKCCGTTGEKGGAAEYPTEEAPRSQPPLIAKWRNGVKLQVPGRFDGEDLYEGLKRAQRSRLEDQRGTEINFEMPDFLKNEENGKPAGRGKIRRPRVMSANCEGNAKFYGTALQDSRQSCANGDDRHVPPQGSQDNNPVDCKSRDSSFGLDTTIIDTEQTLVENGGGGLAVVRGGPGLDVVVSSSKISKPPPLPPKPKHLAANLIKTNYTLSAKSVQKSSTGRAFATAELAQKTDIF